MLVAAALICACTACKLSGIEDIIERIFISYRIH
jgi:hypothetical protein